MSAAKRSSDGDFPEYRPRLKGSGPWRAAGKRPFGATWWGAAWVDAIEKRAQLDPNRLPRGRTYARTGAVDELEVSPGEIGAAVQGSQRTPYRVRVRVRAWSDTEWERALDAMAAEIGHTAALLDGELPPGVATDVTSVGLDLLPGPGEVQPRCSCPDWADPCKHAAAVCYLLADALDADPFVLLLLRGRRRDEVLAALRARRGFAPGAPAAGGSSGGSPFAGGAGVEADGAPDDPGVLARHAWDRPPGALPQLRVPPSVPGAATVLGADAPAGSGVDATAMRRLAADVASRALELALGAATSGLELSAGEDLARWAAGAIGEGASPATVPALVTLGASAGVPARELLRRGLAWRQGGPGGFAVWESQWDPGAEALAHGRALLGEGATGRRNRVTAGDRQLRLGTDGRWYPYRKSTGGWDPDGVPIDGPQAPVPPSTKAVRSAGPSAGVSEGRADREDDEDLGLDD